MWVQYGADRPVLSKMLSHEKEQTTEHYYRVGLREVIEGTRGIDFENYPSRIYQYANHSKCPEQSLQYQR